MEQYAMSDTDRKTLQRSRFKLVKDLQVGEDLLSYLFSTEILTDQMMEEITATNVRKEQAGRLMDILPRRGPKAFHAFVEALVETEQSALARMLDERLVDDLLRNNKAQGDVPRQQPPHSPIQDTNPPRPPDRPHTPKTIVAQASDDIPDDSLMKFDVKQVDINDSWVQSLLSSDDVYKMTRKPRGRAIIINNEFFLNHSAREGTQYDTVNLSELFRKLHFEVETHNDLSAADMLKILREESQDDFHYDTDAFVVFVLSHGVRGKVYGSDGRPLSIEDDIVTLFDGQNCPALINKPKMFFVQACQGLAVTTGVDQVDRPRSDAVDEADATPIPEDLAKAVKDLRIQDTEESIPHIINTHEKADIIIAYSTVPGYRAWRRVDLGSWFCRAIIQVFSQHAHQEHLLDLLIMVRKRVLDSRSTFTEDKHYKQLTTTLEQTARKLYFFPGYIHETKGSTV